MYAASVTPTNPPDHGESVRASRTWWDAEAGDYHDEHGDFLGAQSPDGGFVWGPEGLHEGDWNLLGEVAGLDVLEIGCGSAPCARWIAGRGARAVAVDLSVGMLRVGAEAASRSTGPAASVPLIQADAGRLPFADNSFDVAFSAFGAIPFVADTAGVMAETARVLRPGGRFVFSVNHPMRWIFRDDPGPEGLQAAFPYFDRTPYTEYDEEGRLTYVEHHRTVGDRIRELVGAGFVVRDLIEPEWPEWLDQEWGQWSPLRGSIFPGTAIFVATLP
ncbi:class I SAM-dependent methyltransferase [Rhodococcus sp. IEGM 1408]|nr:class I SAM-dependent methyltransferase [Rhodococcus sp. IEGM 1408]MDV8001743.1 class I SAM-dependent methyltransferase [Rhodococcus sp. IEGM 1408]